jgi:hypothetical protein
MHLMNGQKHKRERNTEGCTVLECGCAHTEVMWLQMCDEHWQHWQERHELAAHARQGDKR